MPLRTNSLKVSEAYRRRMVAVRSRAEAEAKRTWAKVRPEDLDGTYDPGMLAFAVELLQKEAARLSAGYLSAYIASETGEQIPLANAFALNAGEARSGASLLQAFRSPMIGVKRDIKEGMDPDDAVRKGGSRLERTAGLATDEVARESLRIGMELDDRIEGWRRAVKGTCGACLALADDVVKPPGEPLEIHPGCQCISEPKIRSDATERALRPTGNEVLAAMSVVDQINAFGDKIAAALRAGTIALADLVTRTPLAVEAAFITQATPVDLGLDEEKTLALSNGHKRYVERQHPRDPHSGRWIDTGYGIDVVPGPMGGWLPSPRVGSGGRDLPDIGGDVFPSPSLTPRTYAQWQQSQRAQRERLRRRASGAVVFENDASSAEIRKRVQAMKDDDELWVFHSTDRQTADEMLANGVDPGTKPSNLARERYEAGEYAEFAPGRGLSPGLTVAAKIGQTGGYGRVQLAVKIKKRDLAVSPEQESLGATDPADALAVGDAQVLARIPASKIREIVPKPGEEGRDPMVWADVAPRLKRFDPHQPRDREGRWSETPGADDVAKATDALQALLPEGTKISRLDIETGHGYSTNRLVLHRPGYDDPHEYEHGARVYTPGEGQHIGRLTWRSDTGEIQIVFVAPEYRRRKIATAMLRLARAQAKAEGTARPEHSENLEPEGQAWADAVKRFDPHQPRDPHTGEWIDVPGVGPEIEWGPRSMPEEQVPDLGHVRNARHDRVLGKGVHDSLEKHTTVNEQGRRVYTQERTRKHRQIVAGRLSGHREGREHPEILFTAGGPASGKSKTLERPQVAPLLPDDPAHLDQDKDKNELPEYRELAGLDNNQPPDDYASDAVHREAADLNAVETREAIKRRMNIIAEGTGNSGPGQFADRIRAAHDAGYRTSVVYASAPTEVAKVRAVERAKKIGRAVPLAGLEAMHANVSREWPSVRALVAEGVLDQVELWDTRGEKPVRMAHSEGRRLIVDNPRLLAEFEAKQEENAGQLIQAPGFL